jgi:hypothetical protein
MDRLLGPADLASGSQSLTAPGSALGGGAGGGMSFASAADAHRAASYETALRVDAALTNASEQLRALITRVNREFERQQNDPVSYHAHNVLTHLLSSFSCNAIVVQLEQVRSILDNQMTAIQYIDREAALYLAQARDLLQTARVQGGGTGPSSAGMSNGYHANGY